MLKHSLVDSIWQIVFVVGLSAFTDAADATIPSWWPTRVIGVGSHKKTFEQ